MLTKKYLTLTRYRSNYHIEFRDVDSLLRLTPQNLLLLAEEKAAQHVNYAKIGNDDLKPYNLVWVIARIKLEISKDVYYDHDVIVKTWPGKIRKILYPRYCQIIDENGEEAARINIIWSLFDINKRTISFTDCTTLGYPKIEKDNQFMALPSKLEKFVPNKSFKYTPQYHDFDRNNHVNNVKYIDWVFDYLGKDYLESHRLKSLQIDYYNEIKDLKEIDVELFVENDIVKAQVINEGITSVIMVLEFVAI